MFYTEALDCHSLERWEFEHLDDDLRTTHIERELAKHRDEIFEYGDPTPEVRRKYEHLFPADAEHGCHLIHLFVLFTESCPLIISDTGTREPDAHWKGK